MENIKVSDLIAIRGDLRKTYVGNGEFICSYFEEQLVDGKYIKNSTTGDVWTGVVKKIRDDMALVGDGWRGLEFYEKWEKTENNQEK